MYQLSVHFFEMRSRAIYFGLSLVLTIITSYYYQLEFLYIIGRPFLDLNHKFVLIDLTEAFYTILRISGIISFLIIIPFFIYHFWSFFIPSRYIFERKIINKLSILFFFFLFIELLILYFILFPKICEFLLSFDIITSNNPLTNIKQMDNPTDNLQLELTARLESYVTLSTRFYFIMLALFQIPFIVIILYYYNIIDYYILCRTRKFFIFTSILISSFISPPDIISQSSLAILLFFFYEFLVIIGIFYYNYKITLNAILDAKHQELHGDHLHLSMQ